MTDEQLRKAARAMVRAHETRVPSFATLDTVNPEIADLKQALIEIDKTELRNAETLTLDLYTDDHQDEGPNEWGGWKLVPFNPKWRDSQDASDFGLYRNEHGEVETRNIGIRSKLKAGTAFIVSCYEHGGVAWSLAGEGMNCRWDTTAVAGIMVCKASDIPGTHAEREASARQWLETYNAWANGEVYGYSLDNANGDGLDACGGFFGNDLEHMANTIRENIPDGARIKTVTGNAKWLIDNLNDLPIDDDN